MGRKGKNRTASKRAKKGTVKIARNSATPKVLKAAVALEGAKTKGAPTRDQGETLSTTKRQGPSKRDTHLSILDVFLNAVEADSETASLPPEILGLPIEDAHAMLREVFCRCLRHEIKPIALTVFLRCRPDGEALIFHNAPLTQWQFKEGDSYSVGPWKVRDACVFSLACILCRDDIIEALNGLYTPNMVVSSPITSTGELRSSTVIESAIWHTALLGPDVDPIADFEARRRKIIGRLIEAGASVLPTKLPRRAFFDSDGDPIRAAKLAENNAAAEAINFAMFKR